MPTRPVVIATACLGVLAGVALALSSPAAEKTVAVAAVSSVTQVKTSEPQRVVPAKEVMHALLAQLPAEDEAQLPPEEKAARAQIALPIEQQPVEVRRTYYQAQIATSPRALLELSHAADDLRIKLGEDSEAYQQVQEQLTQYKGRVDDMKDKLASLER
jgi:hypothetical protein